METLYFCEVYDFIERVEDTYYTEYARNCYDFTGICIIAHYEVMREIVNCLLEYTDFRLHDIVLENPETDGYADEWILTIDENAEIWCEKAKSENKYLNLCSNMTSVHNDVSSRFVTSNKNEPMVAFDISELSGTEDIQLKKLSNSFNDYSKIEEDDGTVHGFSVSNFNNGSYHSLSFYSSDEVSDERIKDIAKLFGFTE